MVLVKFNKKISSSIYDIFFLREPMAKMRKKSDFFFFQKLLNNF